jgi:hypothetical protein
MSDPICVSRRQLPTKPDGLPSRGGSLDTERAAIARSLEGHARGHNRTDPLERNTQMHPEDLMNADMPSEILLLVSFSVIFVTLLLILVAAFTQTAALP